MKIILKDSKINKGIIQVSLDGGNTYDEYDIAEVKETGISLYNVKDFSLVKIKGSANILQSADVVSSIKAVDTHSVGIILPGGIADSSDIYKDLTNIDIKNGVTSITGYAFSDCSKLTNISIPDSVTEIAEYAFYGCSSLTNIVIPDNVTYIGEYAFGGCSSLTTITLPRIIRLEPCALDCKNLTTVNYAGSYDEWLSILEYGDGSPFGGSTPVGDIIFNYNYQG